MPTRAEWLAAEERWRRFAAWERAQLRVEPYNPYRTIALAWECRQLAVRFGSAHGRTRLGDDLSFVLDVLRQLARHLMWRLLPISSRHAARGPH